MLRVGLFTVACLLATGRSGPGRCPLGSADGLTGASVNAAVSFAIR